MSRYGLPALARSFLVGCASRALADSSPKEPTGRGDAGASVDPLLPHHFTPEEALRAVESISVAQESLT
jgi:hypothetical protein